MCKLECKAGLGTPTYPFRGVGGSRVVLMKIAFGIALLKVICTHWHETMPAHKAVLIRGLAGSYGFSVNASG